MIFKKVVFFLGLFGIIRIAGAGEPQTARKENSETRVSRMVICRAIDEHEPVEEGVAFADSTSRLFCFTELEGAKKNTRLKHRWYHGDVLKAEVTLPVHSASWRAYSVKTMFAIWSGMWRVELIDETGNILETARFRFGEAPEEKGI